MNEPRTGLWRYRILFGLLMLAVLGLGARMFLLIRESRPKLLALATRQQRMITPLPGRVGNIFARAGNSYVLLAGSRPVPSCYADLDDDLIQDKDLATAAVRLGVALAMDPVRLYEKFVLRRQSRFVWIKRDISPVEANAVQALRLSGVGVKHEWRREYPNGQLASPVLGFRQVDGQAAGGIELSEDSVLAAHDGRRVVLGDAARRPIWTLANECVAPVDGRHVMLCIDLLVQGFLESAVADSVEQHDAKWGVGVVADPQTGEVLAIASYPTYNPNAYARARAADRTDRAISLPYEPGSAAKPIFAASAVDLGLLTWDSTIFCENGSYTTHNGGHIGDHGNHYGTLSLRDVIVHSSNIGMAKVGEQLGIDREFAIAGKFGLGRETGVELPGESPGIVRDRKKWDGYSMRRVPFGQEISVTALQLTMAFCAMANGGQLLRPRMIDRITDAAGNVVWQGKRQVVGRALSEKVAAQVIDVLGETVERGTGKACRMEKWSSFGKTGTAQIPDRGGYAEGAFTSSFVGGAPVGKPRLICLISVYWPGSKDHFGAQVAAPYVKRVLEQSLTRLNVPPDQNADHAAAQVRQ